MTSFRSKFAIVASAVMAATGVTAIQASGGDPRPAASPAPTMTPSSDASVGKHVAVAPVAGDPLLQRLAAKFPALDVDGAVLRDSNTFSAIWSTTDDAERVCLIERLRDSSAPVSVRFTCKDAGDFADQGLVSSVPGDTVGLVPTSATSVSAQDAQGTRQLPNGNGVFRVPNNASAVTVGGLRREVASQVLGG